jgi:hypothetical protein
VDSSKFPSLRTRNRKRLLLHTKPSPTHLSSLWSSNAPAHFSRVHDYVLGGMKNTKFVSSVGWPKRFRGRLADTPGEFKRVSCSRAWTNLICRWIQKSVTLVFWAPIPRTLVDKIRSKSRPWQNQSHRSLSRTAKQKGTTIISLVFVRTIADLLETTAQFKRTCMRFWNKTPNSFGSRNNQMRSKNWSGI